MKNKIITLLGLFISLCQHGYSQDTLRTASSIKSKVTTGKSVQHHKKNTTVSARKTAAKKPLYRDTRLGGSSKKYNTYKKNDNGAGAITTNPK